MNDWFSDPFFGGGSGAPADIHSHLSEMGRQMNQIMTSMFDHFRDFDRRLGIDDGRKGGPRAIEDHSHTRPARVEEVPSNRSGARPNVEEPAGPGRKDATPHTYFYSAAMTSINGPERMQQERKRTYDSSTGKTEMAEMRRLGDQALAIRREIDRDGKVTDQIDRQNLDESQVDSFRKRWDGQRTQLPRLTDGRTGDSNRSYPRALK
jgi:hypothetical protein